MTWKLRIEEEQPPPPEKATICVITHPTGAKVYIDGQYVGNSDVCTSVDPGTHTVRAELEGYEPKQTTITCEKGKSYTVEFDFTKPTTGVNWVPIAIALAGLGTAFVGMMYMER